MNKEDITGIIQEVAKQVAAVYDYTVAEALPIVLKCVQAYHAIPLGTIIITLILGSIVYAVFNNKRNREKARIDKLFSGGQELEAVKLEVDSHLNTLLIMVPSLLAASLVAYYVAKSLIYIIIPEAYLVFQLLDKAGL